MSSWYFLAVGFSALLSIYTRYFAFHWYKVTKLIPILIIGFFFVVTYSHADNTLYWFILLGLFFGLFGDMLLLSEKLFLAGLGAFLVGHIFYILAFFHIFKSLDRLFDISLGSIVLLTIAVLALGAILLNSLIQKKKFKYVIPVILYIATISIMVLFSFATQGFIETFAVSFFLWGALLFAISDSVLGINKFVRTFKFAQPIILATYYFGQALIIRAAL